MPKIKIKTQINSNEEHQSYETNAILDGNTIKYKEKDNTTVLYNYKENHLRRENDKLRLSFLFINNKQTKGTIFIKDLNKELIILIDTKKIIKENNNIEIEYIVENNHYLYRIEEII